MTTAILWVRAWFDESRTVAKPKGGDTHSHRIEAHRDAILGAISAQPDITLAELASLLKQERGVSFSPSSMHRFCVRNRVTLKKRRRMRPNRSAPTWPGAGRPGSTANSISTPSG